MKDLIEHARDPNEREASDMPPWTFKLTSSRRGTGVNTYVVQDHESIPYCHINHASPLI
jgi:hypothetical protein